MIVFGDLDEVCGYVLAPDSDRPALLVCHCGELAANHKLIVDSQQRRWYRGAPRATVTASTCRGFRAVTLDRGAGGEG